MKTQTNQNFYVLSDALSALRRNLADYEDTGVVLCGEEVRSLRADLKELLMAARNLENEVSRRRWNEMGRSERDWAVETARAIAAEVGRPGSNVALFPMIPRPFTDGRPEGGAL